ncbi:hypothetical protein [Peribacillus butanolivorans]
MHIGHTIETNRKSHRVVQFTDHEGKEMRVVTSLMNVTAEEIADMYKS